MAKTSRRLISTPFSQDEDQISRTRSSPRILTLSPRILELLTMPCSLEELDPDYRVTSISDELKIGFAISDHATQTDTNEIRELKEFTETTRRLLNFANAIHADFEMYKTILKVQYEEKIQEVAFNLWQDINDRLQYLEEFYKQKEAKMRHSFQQQLCDALAVLRTNYTRYFQLEEGKSGKDEETLAEKLERLRIKTEDQAALIERLEEDLVDYKLKETQKFSQFEEEENIEKELLQQENWEFKQQLASLNEKVTRLQENVKRKEREHIQLAEYDSIVDSSNGQAQSTDKSSVLSGSPSPPETEIRNMHNRREKDMRTIEKLLNAQSLLKMELDREKQRVLSKALEVKEAQETVQKLQEATTSSVHRLKSTEGKKQEKKGKGGKKGRGLTKQQGEEGREAKEASDSSEERGAVEVRESRGTREALVRVYSAKELSPSKEKYVGSIKDLESEILMLQNEIKRLKKSEDRARLLSQRLDHEIRQSSQRWQMKFEILRRSLHAIKDEMFLRQSLRYTSKMRRPLHSDKSVAPPRLQIPGNKKDKYSSGTSLYVHYAPLPGINSQAVAEVKEESSGKIPLTIDIPSTSEGGSDYEEEFEEGAPMPSPITPLPR